jgi:hypothetical protein
MGCRSPQIRRERLCWHGSSGVRNSPRQVNNAQGTEDPAHKSCTPCTRPAWWGSGQGREAGASPSRPVRRHRPRRSTHPGRIADAARAGGTPMCWAARRGAYADDNGAPLCAPAPSPPAPGRRGRRFLRAARARARACARPRGLLCRRRREGIARASRAGPCAGASAA